jgi:hypothetical protein
VCNGCSNKTHTQGLCWTYEQRSLKTAHMRAETGIPWAQWKTDSAKNSLGYCWNHCTTTTQQIIGLISIILIYITFCKKKKENITMHLYILHLSF